MLRISLGLTLYMLNSHATNDGDLVFVAFLLFYGEQNNAYCMLSAHLP